MEDLKTETKEERRERQERVVMEFFNDVESYGDVTSIVAQGGFISDVIAEGLRKMLSMLREDYGDYDTDTVIALSKDFWNQGMGFKEAVDKALNSTKRMG